MVYARDLYGVQVGGLDRDLTEFFVVLLPYMQLLFTKA